MLSQIDLWLNTIHCTCMRRLCCYKWWQEYFHLGRHRSFVRLSASLWTASSGSWSVVLYPYSCGRVLDSRPKGRGFEPHRRHCVVSLSKNINPSLVLVQPRKTRPFITERLLMGRKESNQTKQIPLFHTGHESPESPRIDCFLIRGDSWGFIIFFAPIVMSYESSPIQIRCRYEY